MQVAYKDDARLYILDLHQNQDNFVQIKITMHNIV